MTKSGDVLDCTAVEIVSKRVVLRPIGEENAPEIFRHFTADLTRYMLPEPAKHIDETLDFIHRSRADMERGDNLQFVIAGKESGEFLGCCGLHGRGKPRTPELGIWVKAAAHGHGYGREAISALKEWADEQLRYDYLTYPVDRANIPSRKIPEALGGKVVGEEEHPRPGRRPLDIVVYRILAPVGNSA